MSILERALRLGEAKQFNAYSKRVERINAWEAELELLEDDELNEQFEFCLPRVDPLDALRVGLELLRFAQAEGALEDGHSYLD